MEIITNPIIVVMMAALIVTFTFSYYARHKGSSMPLAIASGVNFFCGLVVSFLISIHTSVILVFAFAGKSGETGEDAFTYNFRFYSLMLLGGMVLTLGLFCLRSARQISRGNISGWNRALRASIILILVCAPLIPLQFFAAIFAGSAILNVIGLILIRKQVQRIDWQASL